ncbi:MAG: cation diffusion facilitator family transporter [Clostridia bacterium]|nr:cation diffusion facilitator family transporter [Clostridia bacterium]
MNIEERSKIGIKVTLVGFIVNVLLSALKLFVGFIFQSLALIADGAHSFSDLVSDIFVMITFKLSKKPADDKHNYGHGRVEVLGEVIVSAMLLLVAVEMIKNSAIEIRDFNNNPLESPSLIVLLVAFISIVSKEILYWYTIFYAKKIKSSSMKANAVHHRSDAISSIAVLVALGAAKIHGPSWYILDPIVAICVAVYILIIGLRILIKSFAVLIDGAVEKEDYEKLMNILNNIPDTSDPHHVRTRKIGSYISIELHIRVNPDMTVRNSHLIACEIEKQIRHEFGDDTIISVHIEPEKVNGEYK